MHGMGDQNRQVCLTIKWIGKVFTQLYHTVINYKLHIYRIDNFALYLYLKSHLSALLAADFILSVALLPGNIDRKSTRLNSSHVAISYAVFCLKKKIIDNPAPLLIW